MPQKKYGPEGAARPVDPSPGQVQAWSSGQAATGVAAMQGAEPQRPRDLTPDEVEALRAGKHVELGDLMPIEPTGPDREPERPRDVSPEDVARLRAGKDFNLESRSPLKANYAQPD